MSTHSTPPPQAAPKPITPQKVRAILRKAGLRASKGHRSKMVRGWVSWSPGYRVMKSVLNPDALRVYYQHDCNAEARERGLERCFEVLSPVIPGIVMQEDYMIVPTVPGALSAKPSVSTQP